MTVTEALRQGVQFLEKESIGAPRLTAEVLLRHTLACERSYLYGHPERVLSEDEQSRYDQFLRQRMDGRPTQYITGLQEFYGRTFRVTPDVMIPRPETEHVVETALDVGRGACRMRDVGCGSGAIAITLQLESGNEVLAADISMPALRVAAANARRLSGKVEFVACDLVSAIAGQSMDLVVSNPPYVPLAEEGNLQREVRDYEPPLALFGGSSGMDFYSRLVRDAPRVLRRGGWLVIEMGIRQLEPIEQMLGACWRQKRVVNDLPGLPRVLAVRYLP